MGISGADTNGFSTTHAFEMVASGSNYIYRAQNGGLSVGANYAFNTSANISTFTLKDGKGVRYDNGSSGWSLNRFDNSGVSASMAPDTITIGSSNTLTGDYVNADIYEVIVF